MNGTILFHVCFSLAMIALPIVLMWWIVRRQLALIDEPRRLVLEEELRPGRTRLAIAATHAALGLGLWFALDSEAIAAGRRSWILFPEICVFHALWWPFAMPVVSRLHTAAQRLRALPSDKLGPVRVASLRPRRIEDDIPAIWRRSGVVTFLLLFLLWGISWTSWGNRLWGAQGEIDWNQAWVSLLWAATGVAFLLGYSFWIRREIKEPQPVFGTGENARTYEAESAEYRRFRVRAIFSLQMFGAALFLSFAILSLAIARGTVEPPSIGVIGGVLGSLLGCLGAAFGVAASVKQFRLRTLRAKLENEEN